LGHVFRILEEIYPLLFIVQYVALNFWAFHNHLLGVSARII